MTRKQTGLDAGAHRPQQECGKMRMIRRLGIRFAGPPRLAALRLRRTLRLRGGGCGRRVVACAGVAGFALTASLATGLAAAAASFPRPRLVGLVAGTGFA